MSLVVGFIQIFCSMFNKNTGHYNIKYLWVRQYFKMLIFWEYLRIQIFSQIIILITKNTCLVFTCKLFYGNLGRFMLAIFILMDSLWAFILLLQLQITGCKLQF